MISLYTMHDPEHADQVRYVGWAIDARRRFNKHLRDATGGVQTHKAEWIRSLLARDDCPVLMIRAGFNNAAQAKVVEQIAIRNLKAAGHDLTNGTEGGDGTHGRVPWNKGKTGFVPWNKGKPGYSTCKKGTMIPEDIRAKISATLKQRYSDPMLRAEMSARFHRYRLLHPGAARISRLGKVMSVAARAKIGLAVRARKVTDATKEKLRLHRHTAATKEKMRLSWEKRRCLHHT